MGMIPSEMNEGGLGGIKPKGEMAPAPQPGDFAPDDAPGPGGAAPEGFDPEGDIVEQTTKDKVASLGALAPESPRNVVGAETPPAAPASGKSAAPAAPVAPSGPRQPAPGQPAAPKPAPAFSGGEDSKRQIKIVSPRTGKSVLAFTGNAIGHDALGRGLGEDFSQYYSSNQFTLIYRDGAWFLRHSPAAKNVTDVNGVAVQGEVAINPGDEIAVGKTQKMPVKVEFPLAPAAPTPAAPKAAPGGRPCCWLFSDRTRKIVKVGSGDPVGGEALKALGANPTLAPNPFTLVHQNGRWHVLHKPGAVRRVCVNGNALIIPQCRLDDGCFISVKEGRDFLLVARFSVAAPWDGTTGCQAVGSGKGKEERKEAMNDIQTSNDNDAGRPSSGPVRVPAGHAVGIRVVFSAKFLEPEPKDGQGIVYRGYVHFLCPHCGQRFERPVNTADFRDGEGVAVCDCGAKFRLRECDGELSCDYPPCPSAESVKTCCPLCQEEHSAPLASVYGKTQSLSCANHHQYVLKVVAAPAPGAQPSAPAPAPAAASAAPDAAANAAPGAVPSPAPQTAPAAPASEAASPAPAAPSAPAPVLPPVAAKALLAPAAWDAFPAAAQELFANLRKELDGRKIAVVDAASDPEYVVRLGVAFPGHPAWQTPAPTGNLQGERARIDNEAAAAVAKVKEWLERGGALDALKMAFGLTLGAGPALRPLAGDEGGWEKMAARTWLVGDVHGDLLGLDAALRHVEQTMEREGEKPIVVFLGDLFDSFPQGLETVCRVLALILDRPGQILWLAGNHDAALCQIDDPERAGEKKFAAMVKPAEFADFLNDVGVPDEERAFRRRLGEKLCELAQLLPRAVILPDGTLAAHAGAPHLTPEGVAALAGGAAPVAAAPAPAPQPFPAGLAIFAAPPPPEPTPAEKALASPEALRAYVWARLVPDKKRRRGEEMGYENFRDFCLATADLGCEAGAVKRMVRGHDHGGLTRHAFYEQYAAHGSPVLTMATMGAWEKREEGERRLLGHQSPGTLLCVARCRFGRLPEVHALALPPALVAACQAPADPPVPPAPAAPAPGQ